MRRVPPSSLVASLVLACLPMTVVRAAAPEAEPGVTPRHPPISLAQHIQNAKTYSFRPK